MLQKLRTTSLGLMLYMLSASSAHAVPKDFTFDVTFDSGPLAMQTFGGVFSLDGFTGSGHETFRPAGSSGATGTLASFDIVIDGVSFDMGNDPRSEFPLVELDDGFLSKIETAMVVGPPLELLRFETPVSGGEITVLFVHADDTPSTGVVDTPEPPVLAMLCLGLAGLGFVRHRKV